MKVECLELLIENNREIEFTYLNRRFSITYYNDDRKKYISFCESGKEPIDVENCEKTLKIKIGKYTLEEIFRKIKDDQIDIY